MINYINVTIIFVELATVFIYWN